jgi:hypothetical protein
MYGSDTKGEVLTVVNLDYQSSEGLAVQTAGGYLFKPENLVKCNVCESCEMAATINDQCKQIAELQLSVKAWTETADRHCRNEEYYRKERDQWKCVAEGHKRNAAYWREELTKLQNEALECRPLGEVATIIRMPKPGISPQAKGVVEYLRAVGPCTFSHMVNGLDLNGINLACYLVEAKDAGYIELVDGKYQVKE